MLTNVLGARPDTEVHLLERQLERNGLDAAEVTFAEAALLDIIECKMDQQYVQGRN